jgi:hypothetical protein
VIAVGVEGRVTGDSVVDGDVPRPARVAAAISIPQHAIQISRAVFRDDDAHCLAD